ncbi:hypothetical protein Fcan01_20589 [Folsomia candida]|uniref:Uncharacterized protein n=1 Tax=Folsomia candida TaxID=158441 RepID=A0A226DHJ1_FOLCA|nr:hypothetical protein Fcan01_20589 [Folsomia candida]
MDKFQLIKILRFFLHPSISSGDLLTSLSFNQSLYRWSWKRPLSYDASKHKFTYNSKKCWIWFCTEIVLNLVFTSGCCIFLLFQHLFSKDEILPLFMTLSYIICMVYTGSGLFVTIGEIYSGSDICSGFSRMLQFESENLKVGPEPAARMDMVISLALQGAALLHAVIPPSLPIGVIYLKIDPCYVMITRILGSSQSTPVLCVIYVIRYFVTFCVATNICRNMSFIIHILSVVIDSCNKNVAALCKIPKSGGANLKLCVTKYTHFCLVLQGLSGPGDNFIFLLAGHALILEIILIFITIRFYDHLPFAIYQLFPSVALNIAVLMKLLIPLTLKVREDVEELLHGWKGALYTSKYLKRKAVCLKPVGWRMACGDVVLFDMKTSFKSVYYKTILDFVITGLLA